MRHTVCLWSSRALSDAAGCRLPTFSQPSSQPVTRGGLSFCRFARSTLPSSARPALAPHRMLSRTALNQTQHRRRGAALTTGATQEHPQPARRQSCLDRPCHQQRRHNVKRRAGTGSAGSRVSSSIAHPDCSILKQVHTRWPGTQSAWLGAPSSPKARVFVVPAWIRPCPASISGARQGSLGRQGSVAPLCRRKHP